MSNQIAVMAQRLSIDESELENIIMKTIMPGKTNVTPEQFVSFMAIANEYKLNPLVKEIYAFPSRGAIQPVVSIDGWIKIITTHPDFDGMSCDYEFNGKQIVSATCFIKRKSMSKEISATEYFDECNMGTDPWKKYPRRMMRHKATIQAGRYAFGISGIIDPDEKERYERIETDITPSDKTNLIMDAVKEETAQEVFDAGCDWIDIAETMGELQSKFATSYKKLKKLKATNEMESLKAIYDERKATFE